MCDRAVEPERGGDREIEEIERRVARALIDDAVDQRLGLDEPVPFDEQARTEVIGERVAAREHVATDDEDVGDANDERNECGRDQASPKSSGRHGR